MNAPAQPAPDLLGALKDLRRICEPDEWENLDNFERMVFANADAAIAAAITRVSNESNATMALRRLLPTIHVPDDGLEGEALDAYQYAEAVLAGTAPGFDPDLETDRVQAALCVLVFDPTTRAYLEKHDPMALRQALNAICAANGLKEFGT